MVGIGYGSECEDVVGHGGDISKVAFAVVMVKSPAMRAGALRFSA